MLKKALFVLTGSLVLLILVLAVAIFVTPTRFAVERDVVIARDRAEVFYYLRMIRNQNEWGPWFRKEPSMKQDFRGTDGEIGFVAHWQGTSDEVGEGEQEIKRIVEGDRVETELRFLRPFESRADVYLVTEPAEGGTKVRWGFTGDMPRPFNLFLLVMDMDAAVGKDFEEGLSTLKTVLEQR